MGPKAVSESYPPPREKWRFSEKRRKRPQDSPRQPKTGTHTRTHTHPHTNTHRRRHRNRHRHTQTMDKKRVTKPKKKVQKAKFPNFLKIVKNLPREAPKKGPQTPPQKRVPGQKTIVKHREFGQNRARRRPGFLSIFWLFSRTGPKKGQKSLKTIGFLRKLGQKLSPNPTPP